MTTIEIPGYTTADMVVWFHLLGIPFPSLTTRSRIDVLLGVDHYELMYSMKEVTGGPNEPCA